MLTKKRYAFFFVSTLVAVVVIVLLYCASAPRRDRAYWIQKYTTSVNGVQQPSTAFGYDPSSALRELLEYGKPEDICYYVEALLKARGRNNDILHLLSRFCMLRFGQMCDRTILLDRPYPLLLNVSVHGGIGVSFSSHVTIHRQQDDSGKPGERVYDHTIVVSY